MERNNPAMTGVIAGETKDKTFAAIHPTKQTKATTTARAMIVRPVAIVFP